MSIQAYGLVICSLIMVSIAAICDRNILQDLSFKISGCNLQFPCDSTKNIYTTSGRYVPKNVIATRMQIYKEDAIVALPRYKHGVPFTLAKFSLKTKGCHAFLQPFPCWSMQEEGNCEALQSVVDIFLDPQEILWALDVGLVNTLEQPIKRCSPKLVGISMKTNQVVKVIDLSPLLAATTRLQYIVVDYAADGKAYAYISDAGAAAIIVYDIYANKGYRVVLPAAVSKSAAQKDVLYLALVRKSKGNVLYFSYLSSPKIYSIKSVFLQTGKAAGSVVEVGAKPEGYDMVFLGTDNGAAIFFRNKGESDVYIWNTDLCLKEDNFILVQKGGDCRLPTQVVPGYKRLMWVIDSNFHDYIANTAGCLGASIVIHPLIKTCDN